ncbi:MAG: InlB B-repeat-containing protein [Clostridia bacterium]|nr:InlB B-repeat-containing protein [Clostridia bacterium]
MSEMITVIFDANGGGITVSSKRVTVGEPYGELPPPARFGYEFDGWFTAEEGGELVDAETIVTAESSHALYAHWTKNVRADEKLKAYRKKKAALKRQKVIIAVSIVLAVIAIVGLCVVAYLVNRTNLEDVDGTIYKIIKKGDTYVLCDQNENKLPLTEDGKYYVTTAGSQIKLDASTGAASIYAYVDTVGKEVVGNIVTARILAFPQVEKKKMVRLEVHNEYGTYAFCGEHAADGTNKYYIDGHKNTQYNEEQFASLIVSCGYVLAMSKIEDPIADENGEYSEYGLVSETRVDAEGNEYLYEPAWYKLTDIDGNEYTVIVGDAIVSGAGYYVRYVNPDYPDTPFIYIVSSDIANTVLQPIEALVEPLIVYPMTLSTYFNVENFTVASTRDEDDIISFSFIPLEERIGTQNSSTPYVFLIEGMETLRPHSTNVDACLQSFIEMPCVGVTKLAPDDEDMVVYGVANPEHLIYYKYIVTENGETLTIEHALFVSEMTERGTYYVYSALFDMIVEIEQRYMPFLEYDLGDWVDTSAYSFNVACTDEITLQRGDSTQTLVMDNSDTEQYTYTAMTKDNYTATGYYGEQSKYYLVKRDGKYVIAEGTTDGESPEVFAENVDYLLTAENDLFLIKDKSTTTLDMTGKTGKGTMYVTKYDKKMDAVLYIFVDESTGAWGTVARDVQSDALRVTAVVDGAVKGAVNVSYFRHFFQTILYASIEGESELSDEQRAELEAKPDSEADLVMSISTEKGDYVFRFFRYSERKTYFTINGTGNYYMISDRVDKIWNDAAKIIAGQDVEATDKN